jgi:carboxyl-terminal processing protease
VRELSGGGAVKFTTARYLTPKGRSMDEEGLEPDVVVEMELEAQAEEETDTQLKKAIERARAQL